MSDATVHRISVPMSDRDLRDLELLQSSPEYREQLPASASSKAALTHAVFDEGMKVIKERAEARIYEEMAKESAETESRSKNRARLSRRGRDKVVD
ncbi:MAG: hypothetical protein ACTHXA_04515 [Gulosibacter sp.]|uniref:hypothetical protein n=1 Tax=Gulosibacter sp. TaxID=2817531 RepID=UPI003F9267BB